MVRLTEAEGLADTQHGDRRPILMSVYFDAKKTLAQGRKVPATLACANPILKDVAEVLSILRIPWQFEARARG
jgi:signal recognition particle subunit SEC65